MSELPQAQGQEPVEPRVYPSARKFASRGLLYIPVPTLMHAPERLYMLYPALGGHPVGHASSESRDASRERAVIHLTLSEDADRCVRINGTRIDRFTDGRKKQLLTRDRAEARALWDIATHAPATRIGESALKRLNALLGKLGTDVKVEIREGRLHAQARHGGTAEVRVRFASNGNPAP